MEGRKGQVTVERSEALAEGCNGKPAHPLPWENDTGKRAFSLVRKFGLTIKKVKGLSSFFVLISQSTEWLYRYYWTVNLPNSSKNIFTFLLSYYFSLYLKLCVFLLYFVLFPSLPLRTSEDECGDRDREVLGQSLRAAGRMHWAVVGGAASVGKGRPGPISTQREKTEERFGHKQ